MRTFLLLLAAVVWAVACNPNSSSMDQSIPSAETLAPSADLPFDAIGILNVAFEEGCGEEHGCCAIPEGCGPKFKLEDQGLVSYTPLLGQIAEEDWYRFIGVRGKVVDLPESAYGIFPAEAYEGPRRAIEVESYTVLGRIRYHGFLVASAGEYVRAKYPCLGDEAIPGRISTKGNKEMGWQLDGDRPVLIVRIVDTARLTLPYVELRYDADTGGFVSESTVPANYRPCS